MARQLQKGKKINNQWLKYPITDITNGNTSFGISIDISDDGSNIFIGAPKEKIINEISTKMNFLKEFYLDFIKIIYCKKTLFQVFKGKL